jgi:hypothetical protein
MRDQTMINHDSLRQTANHIVRSAPSENFCTLGTSIDDRAPACCLVCEMPMTLVRITPKIAAFSEVDTFRCFACGDVQTIEIVGSCEYR